MAQFTADRDASLLDLLRERYPQWKTTTLRQRLKNGMVLVDGTPQVAAAQPVAIGMVIEVLAKPRLPDSQFSPRLGLPPLEILYADDTLLAVDKPSGLLSVASERERHETAIHVMREWLAGPDRTPGVELHAAHRLDRDASGVLLLTRTMAAKRWLAKEWHRFEKVYLAVTDGIPEPRQGVIDVPLWEDKGLFVRPADKGRGEAADTRYAVVKTWGSRALVRVELGTGRKHQIRVHLSQIGCPIVGDLRYGVSKAPRLALHSHILRIYHPDDGRQLEIESPEPALFPRMLKKR